MLRHEVDPPLDVQLDEDLRADLERARSVVDSVESSPKHLANHDGRLILRHSSGLNFE